MKKEDKCSHILIDAYNRQLSLSTYYSPYMLWKFAKSKDYLVRSDLAKALVYDTESKVSLNILCKLAKDKDALVRVEAIDSLSEFCCERSYYAMKSALTDSDNLVRKYASFGLAWIGKNLCPAAAATLLLECEKRENNEHGLVGIYEGMYILGHEEYLHNLIHLFAMDDYQIQCSVLNTLSEIVNEENKSVIRGFIGKIEKMQYPESVQSSLFNLKESVGIIENKSFSF